MKVEKRQRQYWIGVFILGCAVGVVVMNVFKKDATNDSVPPMVQNIEKSKICQDFGFLNEFACEEQIISKKEYVDFKLRLEEYIAEQKRANLVADVAIYFRDLKSGPTMGINEYAEFSTASLLKVPVLVAYLSLAETNQELLREEIAIKGEDGAHVINKTTQHYPPKIPIEERTAYTIEELLQRLIVYSDNTASEMLDAYLESLSYTDLLTETYKELGLVPDTANGEFAISVKRYASVFRLLFNASYLSPEMSDKALRILSETTFDKGLVAGVPQGISVAHKFGERSYIFENAEAETVNQLHDCGIVYFPDNPYLLCVMTRGSSFENLEGVIRDISHMMYEEVDSRKLQ